MVSASTIDGKGVERRKKTMGPFKGVRMRKWGKWVSEIRVPQSNVRIWLGSYDTPEKAARAHAAAEICMKTFKGNLRFPDGSVNPDLKEEIQDTAAKFASGDCTWLPSLGYVNPTEMPVTTFRNLSQLPITTSFNPYDQIPFTAFMNPSGLPFTNFMNQPKVPSTSFINPLEGPNTLVINLPEVLVRLEKPTASSLNPQNVPVLPEMLATTFMNQSEAQNPPEMQHTSFVNPQELPNIGSCEGFDSLFTDIPLESDGVSVDNFLLDEPLDSESFSSDRFLLGGHLESSSLSILPETKGNVK